MIVNIVSKTLQRICIPGLLLLLAGCAQVRLYSNLPEREVNEMVAILMAHGIQSAKEEGDEGLWHITVEETRYADAVAVLSESGRPRKHRPTMEELFPKTGFTSSPAEQRIRLTYGLEQSLESTISALPGGIMDAHVHLVLPDNQPLRESTSPSRANVVVVARKSSNIDEQIPTITQIVIGSVDGLDTETVSVQTIEAEDALVFDRARLNATNQGDTTQDILTIQVEKESVPKLIGLIAAAAVSALLAFILIVMRLFRSPAPSAA